MEEELIREFIASTLKEAKDSQNLTIDLLKSQFMEKHNIMFVTESEKKLFSTLVKKHLTEINQTHQDTEDDASEVQNSSDEESMSEKQLVSMSSDSESDSKPNKRSELHEDNDSESKSDVDADSEIDQKVENSSDEESDASDISKSKKQKVNISSDSASDSKPNKKRRTASPLQRETKKQRLFKQNLQVKKVENFSDDESDGSIISRAKKREVNISSDTESDSKPNENRKKVSPMQTEAKKRRLSKQKPQVKINDSKSLNEAKKGANFSDSDEHLVSIKKKKLPTKTAKKVQGKKSSTDRENKPDESEMSNSSSEEDDAVGSKTAKKNSEKEYLKEKNNIATSSSLSSDDDDEKKTPVRKAETKKKNVKTEKKLSDSNSKIEHLKKYVRTAGIRVQSYTKLFENCKSIKSKVEKLTNLLENEGMKGRPTLEKCKKLKKKIETRKEIESLDMSIIIESKGGGRPKRNLSGFSSKPVTKENTLESSPTKRFSRLRDIIDSEESD